MKNTWVKLVYGLLAVALLTIDPIAAQEAKGRKRGPLDERDKASLWMTKKLEFSQKILAGLTKGDFELIAKNAGEMQVVGYMEKWDRADLPEYRRQLRYFDDANKELIRQAEKKNTSGATLAYTQLISNCVQCHTVVRDAKK